MAEIDIAATYQLLGSVAADMREMKADLREVKREMATKGELSQGIASVRSEVADLRQAVTQYHSAVLGHGILISELDGRLRKVERHLGLSPAA
ncbi:MAG: hypothetical protein OEL53_09180 [Rhodospirillales bacterium]|nr:hypothetical protein [Rhodospirillales bacterium]